jgi:hypothetical protein
MFACLTNHDNFYKRLIQALVIHKAEIEPDAFSNARWRPQLNMYRKWDNHVSTGFQAVSLFKET